MGSSSHFPDFAPSAEFLAVFQAQADEHGFLSFAQFMELALYHPQLGYYRKNRARVGYGAGTDFYTASTTGPVFGELISAACIKLLGPCDPGAFSFVELGAESEGGVLTGVEHPFASAHTVRIGETAQLTGRCIVFSNELFDAQPFHRFVFRAGLWKELGVGWRGGRFVEVERPTAPPFAFPAKAPEGYIVDAPMAASALADQLLGQPWTGLFVAFDYGKSWAELRDFTPAGTARAYFQHTQSNDLLARPGQQDLTCHICWDWLAERLTAHDFSAPGLESQEAFLVNHAGAYLAAAIASEAAGFSRKKSALLQLLHPANMGQKFQVLHATRGLHSFAVKT